MIPVRVKIKKKSGFTLVEVLIFVTLISLIFITFSAITAVSLTRELTNEHKILGAHYAEEVREWIRGQKEINWEDFTANKMGSWCFNAEPVSSWPSQTGNCNDYDLNSLFKREVDLSTNADTTQVTVSIVVLWRDGANSYQIPVNTVLSIYE